jgi:hypothetical protein
MRDVLKHEYRKYHAANSRYLWRFLWLFLIVAAAGSVFLDQPIEHRGPVVYFVYAAFVLAVTGIMLFLFHRLLKAPTPAGQNLMDRIEGFRKVLAATYKRTRVIDKRPETDRPPSLEKYLPYAMALGIESEYVSMRMRNLDWYAGRPGGFSAHDFSSSLSTATSGMVRRPQSAKARRRGRES